MEANSRVCNCTPVDAGQIMAVAYEEARLIILRAKAFSLGYIYWSICACMTMPVGKLL